MEHDVRIGAYQKKMLAIFEAGDFIAAARLTGAAITPTNRLILEAGFHKARLANNQVTLSKRRESAVWLAGQRLHSLEGLDPLEFYQRIVGPDA